MGALEAEANAIPMPTLLAKQALPVRRTAAIVLAALVIVAGTRCRDAAPTDPLNGAPLVGTAWRLVSLEPGAPLVSAAPPDRMPRLSFDRLLGPPRLSVGGNGPCNGFGGRYNATPEGTIRIDSLMTTFIGCIGERGALESAYFDRLNAATTWSVRADSLLLQTASVGWLRFVRE